MASRSVERWAHSLVYSPLAWRVLLWAPPQGVLVLLRPPLAVLVLSLASLTEGEAPPEQRQAQPLTQRSEGSLAEHLRAIRTAARLVLRDLVRFATYPHELQDESS